ncbi:acetyl-CoA synthetase-like protein [Calocera viscosa TUFC12733]|uniref:Acetyl-CoA synthetase-like protein n=1 Tax=Calocera viscosa (strain TUFC12733) TaxID=1330018 RepID=A0A167JSI8_CALVF|nr:acetyl-CoA synthetase-like protein [Calocera viscosa TUFC12733]
MRAGFVPFPLSTRNSVPALEHLIKKTSSVYICGSTLTPGRSATALQEATSSVLSLLPSIQLLEAPRYTDLYPRLGSGLVKPYDAVEDAAQTPVLPTIQSFPEYASITTDSAIMFIHSSGSTTFPKPIPMSHRFWVGVCRNAVEGWLGPTVSTRLGMMGLPSFHGMGLYFMLGAASAWGTISLMLRPSEVPIAPSSDRVLEACKRSHPDCLITVPSFCVAWSQDDDALKYLASVKAVRYGGAPLPQEAGDRLVKAGVNLLTGYGLTELGIVFKFRLGRENSEDWNYGELCPSLKVELVPEGNDLYRLVVMDCEAHPVAVFTDPEVRAFDTNDLLEPHPSGNGLWKIIGRADDQIMMSNGEKTNPGPMEHIISGNPNVQACMMFGRARTQAGIAVEPAEHIQVTNEAGRADFLSLIWQDIEKANAMAPQHSRIFKELVLVVDPERKPLARTAKGTVFRTRALQQYAAEIDALYTAAEQPSTGTIRWADPPEVWDEPAVHSFVARVVNGIMRPQLRNGVPGPGRIEPSRDLFEQGCDSLQATYIRAAVEGAISCRPSATAKERPDGASSSTSVPLNLVYRYPSIDRLAGYVMQRFAGR